LGETAISPQYAVVTPQFDGKVRMAQCVSPSEVLLPVPPYTLGPEQVSSVLQFGDETLL
jgi:hypothetical protein